MTSICIHVSNGVFVSILVRINRRTGAMQTTVKIMKNTIKELDANNNRCSSPDGIKSSEKNCEYFPKSVHIFLDNLFVRKEKICSSFVYWASHNAASSTKDIHSVPSTKEIHSVPYSRASAFWVKVLN